MYNYQFPLRSCSKSLLLTLLIGAIFSGEALAMDLIAQCQADPDKVFHAVRESAQAMPQWRSFRVVKDQRAVKAMVKNLRNYPVPVVIQVQTKSLKDSQEIAEVHVRWEQTMDPVNYPDMFDFIDTFWEQQKVLGLNCVDGGTDVGL